MFLINLVGFLRATAKIPTSLSRRDCWGKQQLLEFLWVFRGVLPWGVRSRLLTPGRKSDCLNAVLLSARALLLQTNLQMPPAPKAATCNWLMPAPLRSRKAYQMGYKHSLITIWGNKYIKWKFSKSDVIKNLHVFFLSICIKFWSASEEITYTLIEYWMILASQIWQVQNNLFHK